MTKQAKRVLGIAILIGLLVVILTVAAFAERYGIWVWALPAILVAFLVGLAVKHEGFRGILLGASAGGLDAIGEWWGGSSNRTKERRAIPADIRKRVHDRAGGVCEHPNCRRTTRNHYHHIDENPSHNVYGNIVYICPNHHDDAHRGLITRNEQSGWARKRPSRIVQRET